MDRSNSLGIRSAFTNSSGAGLPRSLSPRSPRSENSRGGSRARRVLGALLLLLLPGALALPATAQAVPDLHGPGTLPAAELREVLGLGHASLQMLDLPAAPLPGQSLPVRLTLAGMECDIVLLPHSLRADSFQLLVQGADGVPRAEPAAAPATYRGTITGLSESLIAASVLDGQLHAVIRLHSSLPLWGVQPASLVDGSAPRGRHIVYDSAHVSLPEATCATPPGHGEPPPAASFAADPGDKICEIACDTDVEFYVANGSNVTATMNDVELIINAVDAIYDADVGILYSITTILVRTAEPDPYGASGPSALLSQFSMHWNTTKSDIPRDIAHLFTGRDLDGSVIGVAQLGVICNLGAGYGLSQSRFTGNLAFRTALTAHELGHNWNANHCNGDGACSIMCSGLGGCSGNVTSFNPSSVAVILNKKNASGCLADAVPPPPAVLAGVAPAAVQALNGAEVTLTGSGFLKATDVLVGSLSVGSTTSFQKVSDTVIKFLPPMPDALGSMPVVVVGPGGNSGGQPLEYVATDPPRLSAYTFSVTGFAFPWIWGGAANQLAFLLIGVSPATYTFQEQTILGTNLILSAAPLNAAGLGSLTLVLPTSASGMTFYSQAVIVEGGNAKSSNIVGTFVVL